MRLKIRAMRPRGGMETNSELRQCLCSLVRPTVTLQSPVLSCWNSDCKCGEIISDLIPGAIPCRSPHSNYWITCAVAVPALWYEQFPYPQLTMWEVLRLFTWLSNLHIFALAGKLGKFGVARWRTLLHTVSKFILILVWMWQENWKTWQ
jgi:hypothetical protein